MRIDMSVPLGGSGRTSVDDDTSQDWIRISKEQDKSYDSEKFQAIKFKI